MAAVGVLVAVVLVLSGVEAANPSHGIPVFIPSKNAPPSNGKLDPLARASSASPPPSLSPNSTSPPPPHAPTPPHPPTLLPKSERPQVESACASGAACAPAATTTVLPPSMPIIHCDASYPYGGIGVSVQGVGTFCATGPVCAGSVVGNCPAEQPGLNASSRCELVTASGVYGCLP